MKELNEQLEKLIEDAYDPDWEELNTIELRKSITALINDNYVPKEFLNWMGRVGISYVTHAYREENKGKYQRVILKEDNEFEITQYTLDELIEYWKTNIRDK